jgi:acetyl esterase/lipase
MDYDDAYANAPYIPEAEAYLSKWPAEATAWAKQMDKAGRRQAGLSYGTGARERYDLFLPEGQAKGLMVCVQGGYWLKFGREDWLHLSQGGLGREWAVAIPSYDLCPDISIAGITRQVATAIGAACQRVDGPLVLAGHSAGGHLVARMLEPGLLPDHVATRLRCVMPISPLSDLRPLLHTSMNKAFGLDDDSAAAESPVLMQKRHDVPVTVWVGGDERPVFLDQARWLAEAWGVEQVIEPARHHFDVIEDLSDPDSAMIRTLLS